jgi:two-component system, NarL family, sensor histidine kinase UhpB
VLDPLIGVALGLAGLERRDYRLRLPRPRAPELAAIIDRFNALAQALDAARVENAALNHRLITAQDDERKRTALELHDEVGPSLFGLKANLSSIRSAAAAGLPEPAVSKLAARVGESLAIIEHLQAINRSMLNRLRPMALGHVPLRDILNELVQARARDQPQTAFALHGHGLQAGYGEAVDLTVYRCVQESLTNVIKHARAARVGVEIDERGDGEHGAAQLILIVRDDGRGIDPAAAMGFGIRGMQERVQALGGSCKVESERGCGTVIRISIPLGGHTATS